MKNKSIVSKTLTFASCSILFIACCCDPDELAKKAFIELQSGSGQSAMAGTILEDPVEIWAFDQDGDDLSGVTVNFSVTEGSLSKSTVLTNSNGEASIVWTLGPTNGTQTLTITADKPKGYIGIGGTPITVDATATGLTDNKGNSYKVVQIGSQTWMAENLKYKTSIGSWAYEEWESNVQAYGRLYDWETACKVCPDGWHLPGSGEWETLFNYLGGKDIAGGKMKEGGTAHWTSPNTGATNESGFTGLAGGERDEWGNYSNMGKWAMFWSSSTGNENSEAVNFQLYYKEANVWTMHSTDQRSGLSVRCVMD